MFIISKTSMVGSVFPDNSPIGSEYGDEGYLYDYEDSQISDLVSTVGINAMLGKDIISIGDSGISVKISVTGKTGDDGLKEFEQYVLNFVSYIEEAIPNMSEDYAAFYNHFVKNYKENGLNMPFM